MAEEQNDNLAKLLKAGMGAVLLAKDRISTEIEGVLEDVDLGKKEREELKEKLVERTEEERDSLISRIDRLFEERLEESGFVRREKLDELRDRVRELEEKLESD